MKDRRYCVQTALVTDSSSPVVWTTQAGACLPTTGSDARAPWLSAHHEYTPAAMYFDSLGRAVYAKADLG